MDGGGGNGVFLGTLHGWAWIGVPRPVDTALKPV